MLPEIDISTVVISVIVIFVGVVAFSHLWMKKRFSDVPNFIFSMSFVGPTSAIAFDFQSGRVAYIEINWKEATILQSQDLVVDGKAEYEIKDTRPKRPLTRVVHTALNGEYLVTISTNVYEFPELKISFWDRKKAQQCLIALREITKSEFEDDINERTKEDIKNRLIQLLVQKMVSDGLAAEPVGKKVGKKKIFEYIDHLHNNFKKTFFRERNQGDGTLIVEVLFFFFGVQDGKDSFLGYSHSTLTKYVSERHTTGLKSSAKTYSYK